MCEHPLWTLAAGLLLLAVLCAAPAGRADFPEPAKLPAHAEMPDPLVMLDGTKVTTKQQWETKRRPELKKLFQYYMYGNFPDVTPKVRAKIERVEPKALGGKATLKEITLSYGGPDVPKIHLLLVIPNKRSGPAPVFVGMNFCGNHAVIDDPKVRIPTAWIYGNRKGVKNNKATEAGRGTQIDVWSLEQTIDRGYAVATFYSGEVVPDDPKRRSEGIQPHFGTGGATPGPHDWGTIAAWAWGIQRVIDYLVTDQDLDARRIIVVGHSRLGKTALLAGAFDSRIAIVMPHQAGMGGTAPSRGTVGESVKRINTSFPHWFNGAYKQFNDHPERLPIDQNCLVALCAPRPVLFTNAVKDTWANPAGQFEVLKAADPVYRFLGVEGLGAKKMPPLGKLLDSRLGYYIRAGTHSMTPQDWRIFVDFADRHLGQAKAK